MANISSLQNEVEQHHICEANASYRRRRCIIKISWILWYNVFKGGDYAKENKLAELSMEFSVDIINLVKHLKSNHESIISNQIGRSGTSIGANIREAKYAHSRPDFIAKLTYNRCTFTYFYLDFAPFGYSFAEKNPHLS